VARPMPVKAPVIKTTGVLKRSPPRCAHHRDWCRQKALEFLAETKWADATHKRLCRYDYMLYEHVAGV
jgi:hypothetical protein